MAEEGYLDGGVESDFLVVDEIEQVGCEFGQADVALDSSRAFSDTFS